MACCKAERCLQPPSKNCNRPGLDFICGQQPAAQECTSRGQLDTGSLHTVTLRVRQPLPHSVRRCSTAAAHTSSQYVFPHAAVSRCFVVVAPVPNFLTRYAASNSGGSSYSSLICRSCEQPSAVHQRLHLSMQSACLAVLADAVGGHTDQHNCHQLHRQQQPTASTALC